MTTIMPWSAWVAGGVWVYYSMSWGAGFTWSYKHPATPLRRGMQGRGAPGGGRGRQAWRDGKTPESDE